MRLGPYLSFDGRCEEAFKFYERCFAGRLGEVFRYRGTPLADQVPADWQDKVMHTTLTLGDQVLMGADAAPGGYVQPKGFSLSLEIQSSEEAERIFRELSRDGTITVPFAKTFWAERFGMVVDRFGIPWQINCDGSDL